METMPEKQHAHQLIEQLPDSQIETAVRFLEFMLLDPVARAVATAPPDDEPVTEEDRLSYQRSRRGGQWIPMEDVLAEFGLRVEDFPQSPEDAH
jgi:hypothetical protein